MRINKGIFAIKLYEMQRQYALLQSRLELCQWEDHEKLCHSIENLRDACRENEVMLQNSARSSKSPFLAELARAQLSYNEEATRDVMAAMASCQNVQEQAEAIALYAEFAIDFAGQAMNQALLAAMYAADAQLIAEEKEEEA